MKQAFECIFREKIFYELGRAFLYKELAGLGVTSQQCCDAAQKAAATRVRASVARC
jgi:hypothetical protein